MKRHFVHMLSVLVFPLLLVICCSSLFVSAFYTSGGTDQSTNAKSVTLFTAGSQINQIYNTGGTENDCLITPKDFYSPFLVATNDKIIALTRVNSISGPETNINILTKYSKIENVIKWFTETSRAGSGNIDWSTQFAVKEDKQNNKKIKFFLAGASNDKVHILLVNDGAPDGSDELAGAAPKCKYCIITSAVNTVKTDAAPIKWEANTDQASGSIDNSIKQFKEIGR